MTSRITISILLAAMAVALAICAIVAGKAKKNMGKPVAALCMALLLPVLGNLIISVSTVRNASLIGTYIYVIGMDFVMFALVHFTKEYCKGVGNGQKPPALLYYVLAADAVQLLLNPVFGHAFTIESTDPQGLAYYVSVPFAGLTLHRILDYTIFLAVVLIFALSTAKTVRIYKERYVVILIAMIVVGLWQTFYIFSRSPLDRSMIGYGVFGLLVFYLSLYYRPLRLLDRLLSDIVSDMSDAIYVYDPSGKCIWANESGFAFAGAQSEAALETVDQRLEVKLGEIRHDNTSWKENRVIGAGENASYYTLEKRMASEKDESLVVGSFLIVKDQTESQRHLQQELYASTHDSLTGLYTKRHLYSMIRRKLDENRDTDYLLLFINVKNFKIINDIFSHAFGDYTLCQIADWLRANMTKRCVYGRTMGDTFSALVPREEFDAERFEKAFSEFTVSDGTVAYHILLQMGVFPLTERELEVSAMIDRARLALTTIRDEYMKHVAYYDEPLREQALWDQQVTAMLDEAIGTKQLRPFLQPITDSDGKVVGAEALARWIHPQYGLLSPARFIPVLEKNGMIVEVDRHIWRCACEILSGWKGVHDDLFLSINISPKDFYYIDVVKELEALVEEYGVEPSRLRVEITETIMMADVANRVQMLNELRSAGFIVEMDDFGSGYSSLNVLKDMPVDVLKIDMEFLSDSGNEVKARKIVRNIIKLSEELDITPLTEGVETKQQFELLSRMGCKLFQGYYLAKPMPVDEFERFARLADTAD